MVQRLPLYLCPLLQVFHGELLIVGIRIKILLTISQVNKILDIERVPSFNIYMEQERKPLIHIGNEPNPLRKAQAIVKMLHSSTEYAQVLEYAGLIEEELPEEVRTEIKSLVENANKEKDAQQGAGRRATLPCSPHGPMPQEIKDRVETLGISARSTYMSIFLVMRMKDAKNDVQHLKGGIDGYSIDPLGTLERTLKAREEMQINDAITHRLRTLIPELQEIKKHMALSKEEA